MKLVASLILVLALIGCATPPQPEIKYYPMPTDSTMEFIAKCIYEGKAAAILKGHELACLDVVKNPPVKGQI